MAACCPPGSLGAAPLSRVKAVGRMEIIPSSENDAVAKPLPCYVTGAAWTETKRIVLVCTDVFGIDAGHHKVVADRLAAVLQHTTVIIPDFFRGSPVLKECLTWLPRCIHEPLIELPQILFNCKFRVTDKALDHDFLHILLPWLRNQTLAEISCVGFCFGGWLCARALTLPDFAKCSVGIHPSFRVELIFGRKEVDLANKVVQTANKPLLLLPAKNDELKPGEHAAVKVLADARGVAETEVAVVFDTMVHGWVTRGDSNDKTVREQQELALRLAVEFIEKHHALE